MSPTKHTPTPWKLQKLTDQAEGTISISGPDWYGLATVHTHTDNLRGKLTLDPVGKANAEFIVLAVNAYGAMLDTLRSIKDYASKHDLGDASPIEWLVDDAIAKAEGKL